MNKFNHSINILVSNLGESSGLSVAQLRSLPREEFKKLGEIHPTNIDRLVSQLQERYHWSVWKKICWFLRFGWW